MNENFVYPKSAWDLLADNFDPRDWQRLNVNHCKHCGIDIEYPDKFCSERCEVFEALRGEKNSDNRIFDVYTQMINTF